MHLAVQDERVDYAGGHITQRNAHVVAVARQLQAADNSRGVQGVHVQNVTKTQWSNRLNAYVWKGTGVAGAVAAVGGRQHMQLCVMRSSSVSLAMLSHRSEKKGDAREHCVCNGRGVMKASAKKRDMKRRSNAAPLLYLSSPSQSHHSTHWPAEILTHRYITSLHAQCSAQARWEATRMAARSEWRWHAAYDSICCRV